MFAANPDADHNHQQRQNQGDPQTESSKQCRRQVPRDRDVQQLTWDAYMNKELVRARPAAHARIFFKNLAHLTGLVSA